MPRAARDESLTINAHRLEAPKKARGKMVPHRLVVEKLDNGAYHVEQHFKSAESKSDYPSYQPPKTHGFASFAEAHQAIPSLLNESTGAVADEADAD